MTISPILFIIFNRPDTTRRVFEAIKQARPTQLFISADGPRTHKQGEVEKCTATRAIVDIPDAIDWPCEVYRNYSDINQGCKKGVSSAINWFFENVNEGIILEDDCLPDQSFFSFASTMLERYRGDELVMAVRGTNLQFGEIVDANRANNNQSAEGNIEAPAYYFSRSPHIWGWATWRRAWQKYDIEMDDLDEFVQSGKIHEMFPDQKVSNFWISIFKHVRNRKVDTWDTQWAYTIIKSEGLSVVPNVNLIENIGIGTDATHTTTGPDFLKQPAGSISDLGFAHYPPPISTSSVSSEISQTDMGADLREMRLLYILPLHKKLLAKAKKALDLCVSICSGK